MKWIEDFQLFLFDLDGLLVNTEVIHHAAYVEMLKKRGFVLDWSYLKYSAAAHFNDNALKEEIYSKFPALYEMEPNWNILRDEKNKLYIELLSVSKVNILPGAEKLLLTLKEKNKKRCIVTNSFKYMSDMIRAKVKVLETIPHWITREDYIKPKPNPDCYLHAIELYGKKGDRIIGFEDSLRGLQALVQTPAISILICQNLDPRADLFLKNDVFYFKSLEEINLNAVL
ncbi:MAG: hypothetical protein A3F40_00875 [Chlamydiae bacterium RIFCSPHIGHO2_12_FULL_27_8]|nr:MAG: hypothetical protein A3F40_00875 [Chlamydiae bacterium RIFCSPHIGHO2_12_FULL_27_8]